MVRQLNEKTRDDVVIATIMSAIDWNDYFKYYGHFVKKEGAKVPSDSNKQLILSTGMLGSNIDKALAHYSYICYLYDQKILKKNDLVPFEYKLHRIFDNIHICNYLYSLYHFCKQTLHVKCSHHYLIQYGIKMHYLDPSFEQFPFDANSPYTCYLRIPLSENHKA